MSDDLITWLRARYQARREQLEFVRDFIPENHQGEFVDVEQELRELDAKRRILDLHEGDHECSTIRRGVDWEGVPYEDIDNCTWVLDGDCSTVRLLALPYADSPGYREEWKP